MQGQSILSKRWLTLLCTGLCTASLLWLGCSGATKGAAIGAVAGAAAGAAAGGGKGAVIGGAVGATAGAIIGDYMAKQKQELEKVPDADVRQEGDELIVTFNSPILFDLNSAALRPNAKELLNDVGNVLAKYPETDILVMGHTDNTGSEAYNQELSERRAQAVSNYLITRGVAASRLKYMGFGETMPVASNDTETGRSENRRVEVQIAANQALRERDAQSAR